MLRERENYRERDRDRDRDLELDVVVRGTSSIVYKWWIYLCHVDYQKVKNINVGGVSIDGVA